MNPISTSISICTYMHVSVFLHSFLGWCLRASNWAMSSVQPIYWLMSRVLNRPAIDRNYHGFSSITVMFFFSLGIPVHPADWHWSMGCRALGLRGFLGALPMEEPEKRGGCFVYVHSYLWGTHLSVRLFVVWKMHLHEYHITEKKVWLNYYNNIVLITTNSNNHNNNRKNNYNYNNNNMVTMIIVRTIMFVYHRLFLLQLV